MEITLWLKVTMDQVKTEKFCFAFFCRFVTSALTIRPRNSYIYVFRAYFGFCSFLATSFDFWKLAVSLFFMYTKFDFWRLYAANQYSEISGIFLRVQTEERALRVNKSKITGAKTFNGDQFGI